MQWIPPRLAQWGTFAPLEPLAGEERPWLVPSSWCTPLHPLPACWSSAPADSHVLEPQKPQLCSHGCVLYWAGQYREAARLLHRTVTLYWTAKIIWWRQQARGHQACWSTFDPQKFHQFLLLCFSYGFFNKPNFHETKRKDLLDY